MNSFFCFGESFNLWRSLLMIVLYHQTKTPISFWCKRILNPRSLIQPLETLLEFDCIVTCNLQLFLNLLHHDSDYGIWMIIKSSQFYNSHAPLCI